MYAKYIKQEIADLNGTGQTQAYYRMELTPKSYDEFVSQCAREGHTEESVILGVLSLVSEKLALNMAEGYSVKLDGIGTFNAKLGVKEGLLQDTFEEGTPSHNALHTIARRTCEHQFRIEVFVPQELLFELVGISDVVKVKA